MNSKLREHLKTRKIAPIVAKSDERDDEVALKVMCVFDRFLEQCDLYSQLEKQPQLFNQLLNFKSFASFNYWRYDVPLKFNRGYLLVCRICKLIGPYHLILSHMAITHSIHVGSKQCLWCNGIETKTHIEENTLERCHEQYLLKNGLKCAGASKIVIEKFYDTIQEIAKSLGVLRTRNSKRFSGIGRKVKLSKVDEDGDIDEFVVVYENNSNTTLDLDKLDTLFKQVIEDLYGVSKVHEFLPHIRSRKRTASNKSRPAVTVKKEKPNDDEQQLLLPSTSSKLSTPSKSKRHSMPSTSTTPSKENNQNHSAEIPSGQATMKIGSIIDHLIESIPDEEMKQNAILKVHSVALKCLKRAYEKRDNRKNQ